MQEFEITSPDGRIITVTGDKMPTATDLEQIFASLPEMQAEPERNIASGMAHSVLKGATGGLSPKLIAGGEALAQVGPQDISQYNSIQDAIAGRQDYQKKINEIYQQALEEEVAKQAVFEEAHPYLALGADIAGSAFLPVGVASKAKTLGQGIKTGAKIGGAMGAFRGGVESRGDALDTGINMLGGGVLGAFTGGLGGGLGYGLSKGIAKVGEKIVKSQIQKVANTPVEKLTKSQLNVLRRALGNQERVDAVLAEAKAKNTTLAGLGNDNIEGVLQAAEMVSPDARITISNYKKGFETQLPNKVEQKLNETLRTNSGAHSVAEMKAHYNTEAQPYYEQAFQTKVPDDQLTKLTKNQLLMEMARKVDNDYAGTFGGHSKVKADDLQYWDGVKSKIDAEISKEINGTTKDMRRVRNLMEAKQELTGILDEVSPAYKQGRAISSESQAIDDAYNIADRIFNRNMTPQKLQETMGKMTYAEKDAVLLGIKDKVLNLMNQSIDPATGFGKLLPENSQKNIRFLLGKEKGDELINFAQRVYNIKKSLYAAKGNSATAIRMTRADEYNQGLKEATGITSAGKALTFIPRKVADVAVKKANNKTFNDLANLILYNRYPKSITAQENARINGLLRALGLGIQKTAPVLQTLPVKSTGATNTEILKALGK